MATPLMWAWFRDLELGQYEITFGENEIDAILKRSTYGLGTASAFSKQPQNWIRARTGHRY
jgi:hypothetical protein